MKQQKALAANRTAVWEWITGESFVTDYFPEISRDSSVFSEYIKATHKAGRRVRPSWAVAGRVVAWNADAGLAMARPGAGVELRSIQIQLAELGAGTAVTLEVEADTGLGPGYLAARKTVKMFIEDKLEALAGAVETPFDWPLPAAA